MNVIVPGLLVFSLFCLSPMGAATLTLTPSDGSITVGAAVSVNVNISDAVDLYAFQFDLSFSPGTLTAIGVDDGMFLNSGSFFSGSISNSTGRITFIADSLLGPGSGVTGRGTLATIRFTAAGAGVAALEAENVILLDSSLGNIAAELEGSQVAVLSDVPEPGTYGYFGLAAAAFFFLRRHIAQLG